MSDVSDSRWRDPIQPCIPMDAYARAVEAMVQKEVVFLTYKDLPWGEDMNFREGYPTEWKIWQDSIKSGERDPTKIYVLIQHDVDSGPGSTIRMSRLERELGAVANVMTFCRWHKKRLDGAWDIVPYPMDWNELKNLENDGFLIGFHCNSLHVAKFDSAAVFDAYAADVEELSRRFKVEFFSPHGGEASPAGLINSSFEYMDQPGNALRWVHNKYSPKFSGYYSDGGILGRIKNSDPKTDLQAWVAGLMPGKRYRMLIHPQYYGNEGIRWIPSDLEWYRSLQAA